jgi:uncharacterized protein (TIGR01777 family)
MKILMTGATGLIGKEVGKALVTKGHELIVVSRSAAKAREHLPFPCEVIEADLIAGPVKNNPLLKTVDAVINLMGESIGDGRWNESRKRRIYESRVLGTRNLIESLPNRPKIFISASAVGYYGSCGSEELSEDHAGGADFLAQVCQDWEEELMPLSFGDSSTRVVALRTAMVLASQGGALDKLISLFRKGLGSVLGDGRQWMSWIHLEDAVGLVLHALENSAVRGPLNVVAPQPVTNEEFTNRLARALNVRVGPRAPRLAIFAALGEMSSLVLNSQRGVAVKATQTGYRFKFAGLADALKAVCLPYHDGEDVYVREQYFPWKPEEIFPFFSDARNLQKITPPMLSFEIIGPPPEKIEQGSKIHYRIKMRGLPIDWVTRIEDWGPPFKFIDTQEKGPYRFWHHTHEFTPFAGGTLMTDRVRYRLPLGVLGDLFAGSFVRKDIEKIFDFRRQYLFKNLKKEIDMN